MYKINRLMPVWLIVSFMWMNLAVAANDPTVIRILNVQEAILNTDVAQARLQAFQKHSETIDYLKQLEELKKDHDATVAQLQKDSAIMSTEQQQLAAQTIQDKRADSEYVGRKLQANQQMVIQSIMQDMQADVQQVVQELIHADNIGLLLDAGTALHADSAFNITATVTEKLNQMQAQ